MLDYVVRVWYAFCKKLPVFFKKFKIYLYLPSAQNLAIDPVSLVKKSKVHMMEYKTLHDLASPFSLCQAGVEGGEWLLLLFLK